MRDTCAAMVRPGPACPGQLCADGAATGGPDKPGHDDVRQGHDDKRLGR